MPSIAHPAANLETLPRGWSADLSHAPLRSARLRLMVAIPVASVVWVLAAGVLGHQILQSLERVTPGAAWTAAQVAFVGGLLVILGLALLTGWALARSVLWPLRQLAEQAAAFAGGRPVEPVPVKQTNEIGELSARFNTMLTALQRQSKTQSQIIMDQFAGALIVTDGQGLVTAVNRAACDLLGLAPHEAEGRPLSDLLTDGDDVLDELVARLMAMHEPAQGREVRLRRAQGDDARLSVTASVQRGVDGQVTGTVLNLRDLERIEAFHERMKQAEQLAAISTFASGVAHEIRNPLASIKAIAQILGEDLRGDERRERYTEVIDTEVDRLEQIVKELQAFTQARIHGGEVFDLAPLLSEALTLARMRVEEDSVPVSVSSHGPVRVRGQAERMLQALFHVIANALEAAAGRGAVWLRLLTDESPATAVVEIENTGSHIAPEDRERIFTPFYTTKAVGPGLGLAVARQILHQHQGAIGVESGGGRVVFRLTVPLAESTEPAGVAAVEIVA